MNLLRRRITIIELLFGISLSINLFGANETPKKHNTLLWNPYIWAEVDFYMPCETASDHQGYSPVYYHQSVNPGVNPVPTAEDFKDQIDDGFYGIIWIATHGTIDSDGGWIGVEPFEYSSAGYQKAFERVNYYTKPVSQGGLGWPDNYVGVFQTSPSPSGIKSYNVSVNYRAIKDWFEENATESAKSIVYVFACKSAGTGCLPHAKSIARAFYDGGAKEALGYTDPIGFAYNGADIFWQRMDGTLHRFTGADGNLYPHTDYNRTVTWAYQYPTKIHEKIYCYLLLF